MIISGGSGGSDGTPVWPYIVGLVVLVLLIGCCYGCCCDDDDSDDDSDEEPPSRIVVLAVQETMGFSGYGGQVEREDDSLVFRHPRTIQSNQPLPTIASSVYFEMQLLTLPADASVLIGVSPQSMHSDPTQGNNFS